MRTVGITVAVPMIAGMAFFAKCYACNMGKQLYDYSDCDSHGRRPNVGMHHRHAPGP